MSDQQVKALAGTLTQHGYRLTAARQAILQTLVRSGGHVSADDLVALVHETHPHVGRMTVYRTLDLLCELGLARPIYQGSGAAHYILMEDGHHHHLICSGCGRVLEFDDCVLERLEALVGERYDFAVEGHLLELYGRCQACRAA